MIRLSTLFLPRVSSSVYACNVTTTVSISEELVGPVVMAKSAATSGGDISSYS